MSNKTPIAILTILADSSKRDIDDEFKGNGYFRAVTQSNDAVAEAVKRRLAERETALADEAASIIIAELVEVERRIEEERLQLSSIRRQESQVISHLETLAVARVFAEQTKDYLPLYYANRAEWEKVEIPADVFSKILKEVKANLRKPDPNSKASLAKAQGPQQPAPRKQRG